MAAMFYSPTAIGAGSAVRLLFMHSSASTMVARAVASLPAHFARLGNLVEDRLRRRQQVQPPHPAVGWIRTALHQSARFESVDQTADAYRLDFQKRRHLDLGKSRLSVQAGQNHPLGAGHAASAGALVETRAQQPRHVVQQQHKVTVKPLHRNIL
jgi:hypothetical protein